MIDPKNVDVMVRIANIDVIISMASMTDNGTALLEAAEARVLKVPSLAPNHAIAHTTLGSVLTATNRAVQGIAEYERALALDRNLAQAHAANGWAKYISDRAAEIALHINEAFRLSARDIHAHRWMMWMGFAKAHLGADVEAVGWLRRRIEANRNVPLAHFSLAAVLASQGLLDQARTAAKAGLKLDRNFSLRCFQ